MSGREASGIGRVIARLFPDVGSQAAAARPPSAAANRRLAIAKPVAAASVDARSVHERDRERMQRRIRHTREAYARLRRVPSGPR